MSKQPYDPAQEGAQMAFDKRMSYSDYLCLDKLLSAQHPISEAHDEMLFIIQHQTSELWMQLCLHELIAARRAIRSDSLPAAFKLLSRVSRIFEQLNSAWDVLRTMTPSDYTRFRNSLGQSSGFQSHQYRMIEFVLGNRNLAMLKPYQHIADVREMFTDELGQISIYGETLMAARRLGHNVPEQLPESQPRQSDPTIIALWKTVYEDTEDHWSMYELAEKMVDLEDYFRRWRFNHVTTVERVIGLKRGTGGTGGVSYLRRMLEVQLFPELWEVRTEL
jgi:tryptophan 2,3-dioxygenase